MIDGTTIMIRIIHKIVILDNAISPNGSVTEIQARASTSPSPNSSPPRLSEHWNVRPPVNATSGIWSTMVQERRGSSLRTSGKGLAFVLRLRRRCCEHFRERTV
jgi:hypothetical protein